MMGLRGSGKTTVGRLLAERLTRRFIDLDDQTLSIIRSAHGVCSIARAFTELGEAAFRRAEIEALGHALTEASHLPVVLSLGGGTPTAPGASELLRQSGAELVYLRYPPDTLGARLRGEIDDRRPALTTQGDPIAEMEAVFRARDPQYRELATVVLDQPGTPEEVVRALIDRLRPETPHMG
ncbi:MAG: shikimate kinase [bacterium]|nr:shikimate kinase [bacterium]